MKIDNFTAVGIAEGFIEAQDEAQEVEAWQHLHDTGLAYQLQGWFGRRAQELLAEGVIHETQPPTTDEQAEEVRQNDDNLARELGPGRHPDQLPPGYRVDRHPNGAWAWQHIDNLEGTDTWPEFDTEQAAVADAWRHYNAKLPPGYKILCDGIIDPYYVIKDDDMGTIVGGTHAFRCDAVADAWRHWHNLPPNALNP